MSLAASYFRGASQGAVVAAVSACNGLGLTAEQSWAFWRAELSPFVESPFVCDNGERATMCLDRTIPVKVSGTAREAALIRRALAALQADLAPLRGLRVGVGLATSARHPPAPAAVARELDRVLGAAPALQLLPLGPAAFGRAVAEAASALAGGTLDAALVGAVDSLLQAQSKADVRYLCHVSETRFTGAQVAELEAGVLKAYRWQYIGSGAQHPRFTKLLTGMITQAQAERVTRALAPIMA